MKRLEQMHSWLNEKLHSQAGCWTVQRSHHGFSSTAADQTIEQTINRSCKTQGGIRGITLQPGETLVA